MNMFFPLRSLLFSFCLLLVSVPFCYPDRGNDSSSPGTSVHAVVKSGGFFSNGLAFWESDRFEAYTASLEKSSLISIFHKGGPIMWPLLCASILALGAVIDRLFFLLNQRRTRDRKALRKFLEAVRQGDLESAHRIGGKTKYFVIRVLDYALRYKEKSISSALLFAKERELKRFRWGIPILDTVITLAPLLGLLGTVTGMMGSFSLIGGELSAPGAITGGIAEALIATAFGLGIAITSLLPFNFLNTKMEEARLEIESAATQLQLLLHPNAPVFPEPSSFHSQKPVLPVDEMNLVGCNE